MYQPKSEYTTLALEAIELTTKNLDIQELRSKTPPIELNEKLACFVSIHLKNGNLRGCIGTIEPREKNLYQEIISNAVSAATRDSRFEPLRLSELKDIELSVDVLSKPYLVKNIEELDPKKLGVIVTDGSLLRGVLLPNIEGISTVEKQLSIVKRKAGLGDVAIDLLKIYAFTSTRYY